MIKVKCVSNLDDFRCELEVVCCRPQVGDLIDCYLKFQPQRMKIHSITHKIKKGEGSSYAMPGDLPYLELYMTKD
jgi:hypothetical protein